MLKHLFLIDGAAGTGKTDLVSYIAREYGPGGHATYVKKFTTRPHRLEEITKNLDLDLEFVSDEEFFKRQEREFCYCYEYGDEHYAFEKSALDAALARYQSVFVIVRNLPLIQDLQKAYKDIEVCVVYIHSDGLQIQKRLESDGYSPELIEFRLSRQTLVWNDYLMHSTFYDDVIVNNSARADFQRLIDNLIRKYTQRAPEAFPVFPREYTPLPRALIGARDAMYSRLSKSPYERNVFLMMKFRSSNALVADFIIDELGARGFNGVRADLPDWAITDDGYNPIAVLHCCKYGIALFDAPEPGNAFSPNVAYELGMMHLQRKRCLILRHSQLPEMPFNLIKDLHKVYSQELELRNLIKSWLDEIVNAT